MATTPTVDEIQALFETDLDDPSIQILIDAEDAEVVSRFGAHATQTDDLLGGEVFLFLSRPASSIGAVTEYIGDTGTALAANDYQLRNGGWAVERLTTGTNGRATWGDRASVTFTPAADARRKRVIIDLVKLAIQFSGLSSQRVGDEAHTLDDYHAQREAILQTLANKSRAFA